MRRESDPLAVIAYIASTLMLWVVVGGMVVIHWMRH